MSDTEWDPEASPLPPCPIRFGPGSITYSRRMPAELEEVAAILGPMEEPSCFFGLQPEELRRLTWTALTAFDAVEDGRLMEIIGPLFLEWRDLVPKEHRAFFIDELAQAVSGGRCSTRSLGIVVWLEDDPLLIARAAAAVTDARAMELQDAVAAADELLFSWDDSDAEHRAGIFLGLMLLGDPGVLDELRSYRYELTDEEVSLVCSATISGPYNTMLDFQLEWLEEVQAEGDHGKFTMLAAAITPQGPEEEADKGEADAADWRRLTPPGSDDEIPDHWYFPIGRREMGRHLGPRLRSLARGEGEPKVMPAVLEAFELDSDGEAS